MPIPLRNILDEAVKIIKCIKFWPLVHAILTILSDMKTALQAFLLYAKAECMSVSRESSTCVIVWPAVWTSCFFHGTLPLLERIIDKLWLLRLRCLADIFSKMNKVSPSLQGKQLTVFVANDKIYASKLDSFPIFKNFSDEIIILTKVICWYHIMEVANILA